MAAKLHSFRITLRHPQRLTHAQTLDAPSLADAVKAVRDVAADMMGGEPETWAVETAEQLSALSLNRAA